MAMIDKIRKRKELLIIFIGIGMLGFIIPYDAVIALFGRGANQSVGEINGESIPVDQYRQAREDRQRLFNYSSNQSLDADLWNQFIDQYMLQDEYDKLGLVVNDEEFDEVMFGDIVSPYVNQTFYQSGETPEAKEQQRLIFDNMQAENPGMYRGYKNIVSERRLKEKWLDLVESGIYANTLDAKYDYFAKNEARTFNYVLKKYDEIPDSVISYDESDIKAFYREHKGDKDYEQKQGRDIEYVEFVVDASEQDIDDIKNELGTLKVEWTTADNDTTFVESNSNSGRLNVIAYKDGDFTGPENENLLNDSVGSIVGPYEMAQGSGKIWRLAKIMTREDNAIDSVKVRHILISGRTPDEIARAQEVVDSLKAELAGGAAFAELVEKHSQDLPSVENGGEYTFGKGRMDKAFEAASYEGKPGDMTQATSVYGIHLIEILDQFRNGNTIADIAIIDRPALASATTINNGYAKASEFGINYNTPEAFKNAADTMGYSVMKGSDIAKNATFVSNLRNAYELVGWAYDAEVDEVSHAIQIDNKWVVAILTGAREEGEPTYEDVKEEMEKEVIKEKKADMYVGIMGDPSLNNPEEIAGAASSRVRKANAVKFSQFNIPGAGSGREPEVLGMAFSLDVGQMSEPIVGNLGVWVVAPTEDVVPAEEQAYYAEELTNLLTNWQSRAKSTSTTGFYGAMKGEAKIEDNR